MGSGSVWEDEYGRTHAADDDDDDGKIFTADDNELVAEDCSWREQMIFRHGEVVAECSGTLLSTASIGRLPPRPSSVS
jgi:hypothetical protein